MVKARRQSGDAGLSITSLMDAMTIILTFLLMNFASSDVSVAPSDDLQIPLSTTKKPPKLAVNVVVSRKDIVVDGEWVLDLERGVDPETGQELIKVPASEKRGQRINNLHKVLFDKAQTARDLGARTGQADFEFKGEVLLQCDKRLPFSVVREVMFTAGQSQFGNFRFVVTKTSD